MSRTLKPEDQIAHYQIVGPLGAGGMGEVYRARDQSLPRDVALKILPPALVQSEERVRRFELEAKSASSLNHPHIVTIYEIGEDRVRSGGGPAEPDSSSLHYISMELVSGKTLASKIHEEKTDLRTLLNWLAQAAEGLAKAHAAGIVHRDLKPGNIMVSNDGYAKVLDFGLAKLTERRMTDPELSTTRTVTAGEPTSSGVLLGTVGYMSPEQVQRKPVDQRSDIFSFGSILYEAATRRRPFEAESEVETMHRILHDTPTPIEALNREAPAELGRMIRRCLAKDPNQRLDSMKTLALELREIVQEYESLSASPTPRSGALLRPSGHSWRPLVIPVAVATTLLIVWIAWTRPWRREPSSARQPEWRQLTFAGDASSVDLSPDGKTIAYVAGSKRVMVQDLLGGHALEIYRGSYISSAQWTGAGSAVLVAGVTDSVLRAFVIPRLGGQEKLIRSGNGLTRLSPDGKTAATWLANGKTIHLIPVAGGDTSSIHPKPRFTWLRRAGWSRDGERLYYVVADEAHTTIWTTSRDGRQQHKVYEDNPSVSPVVCWAPSGDALYYMPGIRKELIKIYLHRDGSASRRPRVLLSEPGLSAVPFGISDDGRRLVCVRREAHNNLYLWEPASERSDRETRPLPLTEGTALHSSPELSPDGTRVAFISNRGGPANIHVSSLTDGSSSQITFLNHDVYRVVWSPDGQELAFSSDDRDTLKVWRVGIGGGTPTAIEHARLGASPSLNWEPGRLMYGLPGNRNFAIVEPRSQVHRTLVANDSVGWMFAPAWSPDGKHVSVLWHRPPKRGIWVVSPDDTIQRQLLPINTPGVSFKWSADGAAILFVLSDGPPWQIVRLGYPDGATSTVLRLPIQGKGTTEDLIDFTPDLRRVVYAEGEARADVWMLENFDPDVR